MSLILYPENQNGSGLDVPAGNVPGQSSVNKFGDNPTLAASATEAIWDVSSATFNYPATADATHIHQLVDDATMRGATIEVQGLDTNWDLTVQTADLDGSDTTTLVALTTALRRVFRIRVLENIVAAEVIEVTNAGDTTIYGQIIAGNNQTMMATYTVPNGKTAYITNYYASLNKDSGGGDPDVVIRMWHQDNENGYAPQIKHKRGLDSNATSAFEHNFNPYYKVVAKTDIYLTAQNLSGSATADVSAGFDLILVDD